MNTGTGAGDRASIRYPSAYEQRILAGEAPGGAPAKLQVVIPSITAPGRAFEARIAVLDELGYPSLECAEPVLLRAPGLPAPVRLPFGRGVPAVGAVSGLVLSTEGLHRLEASCGRLAAGSNPALCTRDPVPGLYWGDPHVHTVLSNCHAATCRSLSFCFTAARHLSALDWVAAADHASNGRCDFSKWKEQRAAAEHYNDAPAFATLPAYEASLKGGAGGDNNIYMARFPDLFVDEYETGTIRTLCEKLGEKLVPDEYFAVPHHTTRTGKHGEIPDAIYPGPGHMPAMEIHSKWGTSEYRGNPHALHKIHPGPSYAVDLLGRGLRLGFVAGTDTHATMPSAAGVEPGHIDRLPGLTAVRATALGRRAVFDAIRTRDCYAASLERILLLGTIGGVRFGAAAPLAAARRPRIDVLVAAQSEITGVDIVWNGETIRSERPGGWQFHLDADGGDSALSLEAPPPDGRRFAYCYVRVTCSSGAQAWSSPVWFEG